MRKPHLTYNLYWKKYLNYGKHSVIAEYMDKNGLDVYKNVVSIIEQAIHSGLNGVTLIQLSRDKICYVHKSEFQTVLDYSLYFFLVLEDYLDCARVRDIKESLKIRGMFDLKMEKKLKSLI